MFHPGGWVLGSAAMVPQYEIDTLNRLGFIVVNADYRLCPQVSLFEGPIADAKDCFKWMKTTLPGLLESEEGIKADASKTVAIGQSAGANMALHLGGEPNPPSAILDLYGVKYLSDKYLHQPAPMFAGLPEIPDSVTSKIFDGPQAVISEPMFVDGEPNLTNPRTAWYLMQCKKGASVTALVKDGDLNRCDAVNSFSKDFPPTMFMQGTADKFTLVRLAEKAHTELKALGVETELMVSEGLDHAFDLFPGNESLIDQYVAPGFKFLAKHVGLPVA